MLHRFAARFSGGQVRVSHLRDLARLGSRAQRQYSSQSGSEPKTSAGPGQSIDALPAGQAAPDFIGIDHLLYRTPYKAIIAAPLRAQSGADISLFFHSPSE